MLTDSDVPARTPPPLWVDIISPHEVVVAGLRTIIDDELGSTVFTTSGPVSGEPDVVFYDVIGLHEGDGSDLDYWVNETASIVIAVTRERRPDLAAIAFDRGAEAGVSIAVTADELIEVVHAVLAGTLEQNPAARMADDAGHLGSEAGLSQREADVLRLIAQGLSNQDIAEALFLSINSVKTYIRSTYRKIVVDNRAQAVGWALQHGFPRFDAEQ